MDVSTFYALFSATCFTLTGLWWGVVEKHQHWLRDPGMRRRVGSVYLAFLLPALMGLFAQIGGSESPGFWRVSFVVIAVIGCASTVTLLRRARAAEGAGAFARYWWAAGVVYALVAVLGVAPGDRDARSASRRCRPRPPCSCCSSRSRTPWSGSS